MRTRIVEHSELGLLQVVLDQELEWNLQSDVNSYLAENEKASMGLGDPLYRLALIGSGLDFASCLVRWMVIPHDRGYRAEDL